MNTQKKLKKENETKLTIRIYSDLLAESDKRIAKANCKSRTEYIEKALAFYNHYLDSDNQVDYLAPVLSQIFDNRMQSFEGNINRNIFKIAVELGKVLNVLAAVFDVNNEVLEKLQIKCVDEVKKINGIITFENAYNFQKQKG